MILDIKEHFKYLGIQYDINKKPVIVLYNCLCCGSTISENSLISHYKGCEYLKTR